jgi:ribosome-binding protein aMBF1 (putative translation factor)
MKDIKPTENGRRVCPICGSIYTGAGAPAKRDGAEVRVCPDCGTRNALSEMGLTPEEIQQILTTVHRYTDPLLAPV